MNKDIKLDDFEQDIDNNSENYVPISNSKKKKIETIIREAKKSKNINIRINNYDLELVKKRVEEEGIPWGSNETFNSYFIKMNYY